MASTIAVSDRKASPSLGLEKVRLSGWEALADVRLWFQNRCVGRVSLVERGLEKIRLSGRECSCWRPSGDRGSPSRTGLDRRVKVRWSEGLAVNRQRGWVGLAGRRIEKESLSFREALADVRLWFQNRRVGTGKPRRAGGLKR